MGLLNKLIIKKISQPLKLAGMQRCVFIGPHPDDIEIGAGGTAARLAAMGADVHFLIATDGCCGAPDEDKTMLDMAKIRAEETAKAAALLGAKSVVNLGFQDGGSYTVTELQARLTKELARLKPDVIFAPDPRLASECHADHLKTGEAAMRAFLSCGNRLLTEVLGETPAAPKALCLYYTDRPNYYVGTRKYRATQRAALAAHKSQMLEPVVNGSTPMDGIWLYITYRALRFGLKRGKGYAEGFRMLTPLTSHCCAEKL